MKRLMLILPLLLLAADEKEIRGWKVVEGSYQKEGGGVRTSFITMEYEEPIKKTVTMTFRLNIREWKDGLKGYSFFGIGWQTGIKGKARLQMVFNKDGRVRASAYPDDPAVPPQSALCILSRGAHRIMLAITREGVSCKADSTIIKFALPAQDMGKLTFYLNGPDIVVSDIRIKLQ
ncbi:MAG: hypothetical protein AB1696_27420 [Planctomycetota bacterium]